MQGQGLREDRLRISYERGKRALAEKTAQAGPWPASLVFLHSPQLRGLPPRESRDIRTLSRVPCTCSHRPALLQGKVRPVSSKSAPVEKLETRKRRRLLSGFRLPFRPCETAGGGGPGQRPGREGQNHSRRPGPASPDVYVGRMQIIDCSGGPLHDRILLGRPQPSLRGILWLKSGHRTPLQGRSFIMNETGTPPCQGHSFAVDGKGPSGGSNVGAENTAGTEKKLLCR